MIEAGRFGSASFSQEGTVYENQTTDKDDVLYNAFPFNLLKGLVITAFTMLVYKRIRPLLKGKD